MRGEREFYDAYVNSRGLALHRLKRTFDNLDTALGSFAPKQGHLAQADEAQMIQELYQGLSRMEERVETLETLLLDQERKGEGKQ